MSPWSGMRQADGAEPGPYYPLEHFPSSISAAELATLMGNVRPEDVFPPAGHMNLNEARRVAGLMEPRYVFETRHPARRVDGLVGRNLLTTQLRRIIPNRGWEHAAYCLEAAFRTVGLLEVWNRGDRLTRQQWRAVTVRLILQTRNSIH